MNICFSVDKYLGVELLGHMVTLCLHFQGTDCFPEHLYHFTFPAAMCENCHFSASSPLLVVFHFLKNYCYTHSSEFEVISCSFDLHFSNVMIFSIFSYTCHLYIFGGKCHSNPLSFFKVVLSFDC